MLYVRYIIRLMRNNKRPKTDLCGTPTYTSRTSEIFSSFCTNYFQFCLSDKTDSSPLLDIFLHRGQQISQFAAAVKFPKEVINISITSFPFERQQNDISPVFLFLNRTIHISASSTQKL